MAKYKVILKSGYEIEIEADRIELPEYPKTPLDIWDSKPVSSFSGKRNEYVMIREDQVAAILRLDDSDTP